MHIAYTHTVVRSAAYAAFIAGAIIIFAGSAHAQVTQEESAALQAQLQTAQEMVDDLKARPGKVLGLSTLAVSDSLFKQNTSSYGNILDQLESLKLRVKNFNTSSSGSSQSGKSYSSDLDDSIFNVGNGPRGHNVSDAAKKAALEKQIKEISERIESLTKQKAKLQAELDKFSASSTTKIFTIKDVKSVTAKYVDPNSAAADDEYTLFTIVLKSGTVVEVKQCGFCLDRDAAFKKAGYKGKVEDLRKKANIENADGKKSPRFISVEDSESSNKVNVTVFVRNKIARTVLPVVMGPITLGTINWGDQTPKEKVNGLFGQNSIELTHTYKEKGDYTIKLTDDYGSVTAEVTVGKP